MAFAIRSDFSELLVLSCLQACSFVNCLGFVLLNINKQYLLTYFTQLDELFAYSNIIAVWSMKIGRRRLMKIGAANTSFAG
jgi:hypothetical protein